ncbi:HMR1 protein, partial [Oreocharis arfaki]|nr:HMR1 protein [Oreocharis arfaki]
VAVSEPGPRLPSFWAMGFVDGIPFARYGSRWGRMEPQMLRMAVGAELGYCDNETPINESYQQEDPSELERLQVHPIPPHPCLHTLQRECSCDLSNGSICGFFWQGCDGRDFISFDLGSGSFVVANGTAQITKRCWESDGITVPMLKNALEHTCMEVLQKHIRDGWEALECK